ncbi:MAG TPA: hypothetical protein VJN39_14810 [Gemmatimonadales bacterium]|nr:hypothetical protein [Gemmatimonadales bacterium]
MTVYRCTASGAFASGLTWSFRQHFNSTSSIATVSADWSAHLVTWWTDGTNGMQGIYPTGTTFDLSTVAALSGVPFREGAKLEQTHSLAGALSTDSLPEQSCIVVSLRAAEVGRKNRGRIHYPAPAEDKVTGGVLNSTESTHVSTATNVLYAAMRAAGHDPVIYNSHVSKVPSVDPVVQTLKSIATEEIDRNIRTQRRRTRKRRPLYV